MNKFWSIHVIEKYQVIKKELHVSTCITLKRTFTKKSTLYFIYMNMNKNQNTGCLWRGEKLNKKELFGKMVMLYISAGV